MIINRKERFLFEIITKIVVSFPLFENSRISYSKSHLDILVISYNLDILVFETVIYLFSFWVVICLYDQLCDENRTCEELKSVKTARFKLLPALRARLIKGGEKLTVKFILPRYGTNDINHFVMRLFF